MTPKKKAPKISWRELMEQGPAAETPAGAEPPPAEPAVTPAPVPGDAAGGPPANTVMPAEEPAVTASARPAAKKRTRAKAAEVGGPPPDSTIAATTPERESAVTPPVAASRAEPAPAPESEPASEPASAAGPAPESASEPAPVAPPADIEPATPTSEVWRILGKLSSRERTPRPRPAPAAPAEAAPAADAPRRRSAREELEPEATVLVTAAGLRDAARSRKGRVELLLFRVGPEVFAMPLGAVEEAVEAPTISPLPEMPASMLGVFRLRERLVHAFTPARVLGVPLVASAGAALLVSATGRRLAIVVDDVEDVMELDLATLREPPVVEDTDGLLVGVARFGRELVGVLDADALITACLGGRLSETP